MARLSRFYIERVSKAGRLTDDGIREAILDSTSVESRRFAWTITSPISGTTGDGSTAAEYIGGFLAKYEPDAVVEVIDEETKTVLLNPEPNMQVASAQFVYIPSHAALAHRHIWNKITAQDFRKRFSSLISSKFRDFFVECELRPITDYRQFYIKLAEMDTVRELKAKVNPPNPLFGPLWRELSQHIRSRNAKSLSVEESSASADGLNSQLPEVVRQSLAETPEQQQARARETPLPIEDAAIVMAADGYGRGEVTGVKEGASVVIRTSDDAVLLRLPADVSIEDLANQALTRVLQLNRERALEHEPE